MVPVGSRFPQAPAGSSATGALRLQGYQPLAPERESSKVSVLLLGER